MIDLHIGGRARTASVRRKATKLDYRSGRTACPESKKSHSRQLSLTNREGNDFRSESRSPYTAAADNWLRIIDFRFSCGDNTRRPSGAVVDKLGNRVDEKKSRRIADGVLRVSSTTYLRTVYRHNKTWHIIRYIM